MENWINKEIHSWEFSQERIDELRRSASENLRFLREEIGVNQEAFAKVMGVSRAALSYYENNSRTPDIDFINKVALHTDCSLSYLMGWAQSMSETYVQLENILDLTEEEIKRLYGLLEFQAFHALLFSESFENVFWLIKEEARKIIEGTSKRELAIWKCMKSFETIIEDMLSFEMNRLLEIPKYKEMFEKRKDEVEESAEKSRMQFEELKGKQSAELEGITEKQRREMEGNPFALFRCRMFEESMEIENKGKEG